MKKKRSVVAVSGGFDPIHIGHIRMFKKAKALGDSLTVIVNNDHWLSAKKGFVFMPEAERVELIRSLPYVDEVVLTEHTAGDPDRSVITSLRKVRPAIFANGGDRRNEADIPEAAICKDLGIEMIFNVGEGGKVQSSSWMIQKAADSVTKQNASKTAAKVMPSVFSGLYADAYDLMYKDKEYDRETAYVLKALSAYGTKRGRMLSIGAGTLSYETRLAKKGWTIVAVDYAQDMVDIAAKKISALSIKNIDVECADMHALRTYEAPFDAAIAMFNVIAYSKNIADIRNVFRGVAKNLSKGGVFVLDCWNQAAIDRDPPQSRFKRFSDGEREVYRLTVIRPKGEKLELHIELLDIRAGTLAAREKEVHTVRGWTLSELRKVANEEGFNLVHASVFPEWSKKLNTKDWSMGLVFKKK